MNTDSNYFARNLSTLVLVQAILATPSVAAVANINSVLLKTDPATGYQYLSIAGSNLKDTGNSAVTLAGVALSKGSQDTQMLNFYCPSDGISRTCPTGDWKLQVTTYTNATTPSVVSSAVWNLTLGAVGPQGPTGAVGPKGDIGPQGPTGVVGPKGATGPQGPTGAVGPKGATGLQGPTGAVGPKGDTGPQGVAGAVGPKGATGSQGPAGTVGPKGATGPQGPIGATGPKGDTGPQGAAGVVGPKGDAGPPGPAVHTSAVCVNYQNSGLHTVYRSDGVCTCATRVVSQVFTTTQCQVTADTGTCSAQGDSYFGTKGSCCVCSP